MPLKPCLDCNRLSPASRCPGCAQKRGVIIEARKHTRRPPRSWAEQQRRAEAVRTHVATYGWVCPGLPGYCTPHPCTDLTADHVVAVGAGGSEAGPLRVLCRPTNSARGKRPA